MPKLFISLMAFAMTFMLATGPCFAKDPNVIGTVSAIDTAAQKFTVTTTENKTLTFVSTPATDYEWEDTFFDSAKFEDLKQGLWVKVKYIAGETVNTAKDVDLYKEKK